MKTNTKQRWRLLKMRQPLKSCFWCFLIFCSFRSMFYYRPDHFNVDFIILFEYKYYISHKSVSKFAVLVAVQLPGSINLLYESIGYLQVKCYCKAITVYVIHLGCGTGIWYLNGSGTNITVITIHVKYLSHQSIVQYLNLVGSSLEVSSKV